MPAQRAHPIRIEQSAQDGCIVVSLFGDLGAADAPKVQTTLLRCLAEQPDAVICDLSGLDRIDPVCATVFSAVTSGTRRRWPDSTLLLCRARPAVAEALGRPSVARFLMVYDTMEQALAHVRSRPAFLRERLRLVPTLDAITTARWFVGEVCQRWQADELTKTAQLVAGELVTDAVLSDRPDADLVELRIELRAGGPLIAVTTGGAPPAADAEDEGDAGPGLELVRRVASGWGVRRRADGSRVVWCSLSATPEGPSD